MIRAPRRAREVKTLSDAIVFRLFFVFASVLITVALSRYFGVEEFGRYSWAISIAFLLSGLAQAGANSLVVRETSRSNGRHVPVQILKRTSLISGGALAALILAMMLFTAEHMESTLLVPLVLLAAGNLALVLMSAANRGIGRLKSGQIPELVLRPALFLVLIGLIFFSRPKDGSSIEPEAMIYWLVSAYGAASIVAAALLLRGLAARPVVPGESPEADWIKSFVRLGLIGCLAVGNAQLLIILTGALADSAEVALYRVAAQAVLIMGLGLTAIETVQAPGYARAYMEGDMRRLHALLQQSCRVGIAISAAVMLFLLLFGQSLLVLVFGDSYAAAFPVICVLAGGQLINALTGNVGVLLIAAKQEQKLMLGNLAALLATMVMAWLFIPQYGAMAAAAAAGIGLTLRNLLALWFCYRGLGLISLPFAPFMPAPEPSKKRDNT